MSSSQSFVAAVEQKLHRLQADGFGSGMVAAVSGGPDSVALLHALLSLGLGQQGRPLILAHLNHLLRGAESEADEDFVRTLHARLAGGAPFLELSCERIDVRTSAVGGNLEAEARRIRYDWLARTARASGIVWVATGHTADDQAETVLHRLLRGSGLKGLRGIASRRPLAAGVELVRPMLAVRRSQVLAYLDSLGKPWRQDSSNFDTEFTRNRIRRDLLPMLAERYNPQVVVSLCRLAEQAEEAYAVAEEEARALLSQAERPRAGQQLVLDRACLAAAPRQRVREVFRLIWEREGWPLGQMGYEAWERIAAVVLEGTTAVDLPGGVHVRSRERVVQVKGPG